MTVCPYHRYSLGINWKPSKKCIFPLHKGNQQPQKGVTPLMSKTILNKFGCLQPCFDQVSSEESIYSSGYKLRECHFQQFDDNYSDVTQQSQSLSQPLSQISNWSDEMETTLDQANATLKILNCKSSPLRGQLLSDISSLKDSTIRYYKRKADKSVDSVLNIIAPGQSKELKKLIMSEPTKPPTDDELTDTILKLYEETADNKLQTQILSIVSKKMTKM
ncbi:Hypothetical predicted protein [Mytilus galloprovincialis]|uniref:Uncharacterized protein n=1 Tax=Mytilus galloprovincialis TaxID=29158 RepID=A0A8B6GMX3_MYTGA|nr:Hypothetical predicted protein [Mytilus galloprovincialis]